MGIERARCNAGSFGQTVDANTRISVASIGSRLSRIATLALDALHADGKLAPEWTPKTATDVLWTMLLVPNWENLTGECGWSTQQYVRWMKTVAERAFVKE